MGNRLITFIFGISIGVACTYLYFKKKMDILVSDKVTEELKKEFDRTVGIEVIPDNELNAMPEEMIPDEKKENKQIDTHKVAYQNATKMYKEEEPDFMTKEEYLKEFPDPVIITEQEHEENYEDYDVINCTYNYADDTLQEDTGGYIEDIDFSVGYENLEKFRDNMMDYIWVRNKYLKTDYCIELDYESNMLY